jgi:hypothetical protein
MVNLVLMRHCPDHRISDVVLTPEAYRNVAAASRPQIATAEDALEETSCVALHRISVFCAIFGRRATNDHTIVAVTTISIRGESGTCDS